MGLSGAIVFLHDVSGLIRSASHKCRRENWPGWSGLWKKIQYQWFCPPAGVVYRWGGGYQQESYRPRSEKECYVTRLGKGPGLGAGYRFGNQPVITYGKVNCLGIIL